MEKEKKNWKKEANELREELKRKSEPPTKSSTAKRRKFNQIKNMAKKFIKN
jgi:hypothetical protein